MGWIRFAGWAGPREKRGSATCGPWQRHEYSHRELKMFERLCRKIITCFMGIETSSKDFGLCLPQRFSSVFFSVKKVIRTHKPNRYQLIDYKQQKHNNILQTSNLCFKSFRVVHKPPINHMCGNHVSIQHIYLISLINISINYKNYT